MADTNKPVTEAGSKQEVIRETITQKDAKEILDSFEEAKHVKEEFIGIFGLFAAILIFSSVEVRVFSTTTRFSLILGISSFFISSLMLFVLTLHNIIHGKRVRDYKSMAFILSILVFIFSMQCFYWATHYNAAVHHSYIWFFGNKWV